jgi:hypothetical protein
MNNGGQVVNSHSVITGGLMVADSAEVMVNPTHNVQVTEDYVGFLTAEAKFYATAIWAHDKRSLSPQKQAEIIAEQPALAMAHEQKLSAEKAVTETTEITSVQPFSRRVVQKFFNWATSS